MANIPQNTTYSQPATAAPVAPKRFGAVRQAIASSSASAPASTPLPPAPSPAPKFNAQGMGNVTTQPGTPTRDEPAHPGLDIAGPKNQTIPAFQPGTVTDVRRGQGRGGGDGFGNYAVVTDIFGNQHRYSHLSRVWVQMGQQVGQGTPIGTQGNSGNTYSPSGKGDGSHLDYRVADIYNRYVSPNSFVKTPNQQQ